MIRSVPSFFGRQHAEQSERAVAAEAASRLGSRSSSVRSGVATRVPSASLWTPKPRSASSSPRSAPRSPEQAALPAGGEIRRGPGLRHAEVAVLAGRSTDWLRPAGEGPHDGVSDDVLDDVPRAWSSTTPNGGTLIVEGYYGGRLDARDVLAAYDPAVYGPLAVEVPPTVLAWRTAGWAGHQSFQQTGGWTFS